jgi:antitoxin PrlF
MSMVLDVVKVTSKGQITIPSDVRELIGVRAGDKVLFVKMDDGAVVLRNSTLEEVTQAE